MSTTTHGISFPLARLRVDLDAILGAMCHAHLVLRETVEYTNMDLDLDLLRDAFADVRRSMSRADNSAQNLQHYEPGRDVHQVRLNLRLLEPIIRAVVATLRGDPTRADLSKALDRYDAAVAKLGGDFLGLSESGIMVSVAGYAKTNDLTQREHSCLKVRLSSEKWRAKHHDSWSATGKTGRTESKYIYAVTALDALLAEIRE